MVALERDSSIDSLASDFDNLPDAQPVTLPSEATSSEDRTPDEHLCGTCDEQITREPGAKGRWPKYHPQCRPSALGQASKVFGGGEGRKTRSDTKAAKEADECVALIKGGLVKVALGVSMVDRYDGFCIMTGIPTMCDNIKGILIAHESWRKDILNMRTGGSIVGLILAALMVIAPMAAHHGLIPVPRIAQMLQQLPLVLHKVAKRMKEGEEALTDMMARAADGMADDILKPPANAADAAREKAAQNGGTAYPTA